MQDPITKYKEGKFQLDKSLLLELSNRPLHR